MSDSQICILILSAMIFIPFMLALVEESITSNLKKFLQRELRRKDLLEKHYKNLEQELKEEYQFKNQLRIEALKKETSDSKSNNVSLD